MKKRSLRLDRELVTAPGSSSLDGGLWSFIESLTIDASVVQPTCMTCTCGTCVPELCGPPTYWCGPPTYWEEP